MVSRSVVFPKLYTIEHPNLTVSNFYCNTQQIFFILLIYRKKVRFRVGGQKKKALKITSYITIHFQSFLFLLYNWSFSEGFFNISRKKTVKLVR